MELKHSRQSQLKIVTRTSEEKGQRRSLLHEVIIIVSETQKNSKQEKCYLDYTKIVKESSSAAESKNEENCLGN